MTVSILKLSTSSLRERYSKEQPNRSKLKLP